MKVKAKRIGFYDYARRREGDVFTLKEIKGLDRDGKSVTYSAESQFSEKWMEKLEGNSQAKAKGKKHSNEESMFSDEVI